MRRTTSTKARSTAYLLKRLSACQRRSKNLATRVVQLERSRDLWKQKAIDRSRQNMILRYGKKRRAGVYWAQGLTPDEINLRVAAHRRIVQRILAIPPRSDIE